MTNAPIALEGSAALRAADRAVRPAGWFAPAVLVSALTLDCICAALACILASDLTLNGTAGDRGPASLYGWSGAAIALNLLCLALFRAYDICSRLADSLRLEVETVVKSSLAASAVLGGLQCARIGFSAALFHAVSFGIASAALLALGRFVLWASRTLARRLGFAPRNVLIVGPDPGARPLERAIRSHTSALVAGVLVTDDNWLDPGSIAASARQIERASKRLRADDVFILDHDIDAARAVSLLSALGRCPFRLWLSSAALAGVSRRAAAFTEDLAGLLAVRFQPPSAGRLARSFKRAFDCAFSLAAVVILSPFWLLLAAVLYAFQGRPIFFKQARVKSPGGQFTLYKFRTMSNNRFGPPSDLELLNKVKGPMFKAVDDPRITRIGRWLRRFSIDETPQFINVLLGHMSVVGVRPPLPEEVDHYEPWHLERLKGHTGITGLWQVSGRSDVDFDEVVFLDVCYNRNLSVLSDLDIALRTLPAILGGKGAY